MEKHYKVKPILYSGKNFANAYLQGFSDYPLWLAEYEKGKTPQLQLDWKRWTFWQHTQGGRLQAWREKSTSTASTGTCSSFRLS